VRVRVLAANTKDGPFEQIGAEIGARVSLVAVCCSVLQCVAVRCSVLQCVAMPLIVCCTVLQCVAVCLRTVCILIDGGVSI